MNALALETAVLSADGNELVILDQTLLPNEIRYLHLTKKEEIWEAINKLRVRGAPAIGVAAAYGLYVVARTFDCHDSASFIASLKNAAAYLDSSRPTAVNLSWALRRMVRKAEENASCAVHELLHVLSLSSCGRPVLGSRPFGIQHYEMRTQSLRSKRPTVRFGTPDGKVSVGLLCIGILVEPYFASVFYAIRNNQLQTNSW